MKKLNRIRQPVQGMTIINMIVSMGIFALLTGPILQAVLSVQGTSNTEEKLLSQFQPLRGSFYQIVRELQMAGYPASNNFPPAVQAQSPGLIAGGFITATATDVVFESDTDFNGTVERIEYLVSADGESISRRVSLKAKDGTVGSPISVQDPFISKIANSTLASPVPVFSWETNSVSAQPFPNNISVVYVSLAVQVTPDPLKPASQQIINLSGAARRINPSL
jgi:type II secretory pathway pseudopilin PulG